MQTTASDISVLIIGTLAVLHTHNLFYELLLINATKVRPESAGEITLLRGHLSRPWIDISCRVHVVESIAVSVGGACGRYPLLRMQGREWIVGEGVEAQ